MKKFLLPQLGNFYKANLHCHSNISDGKLSVEELKELYKSNGYSIVAFTDHDVFLTHNDLTDSDFLALNGYEWEIYEDYPIKNRTKRTFHACLIAKNNKIDTPILFHREKYFIGNGINYIDKINYDKSAPDFEREYSPKCVNEFYKIARKSGFFTTYNHPTWSGETYKEYMAYEGMDAMEIYNHECSLIGFDDYNPRVYDDMLRGGKKIFCVAGDDNHNKVSNSCGGFVVIKANSLDYNSIINALERGDFYSSQGPEIKELYYEDGAIYVTTSPAKMISLTNSVRRASPVRATENELVTTAKFPILPDDGYVRITVTDENGLHANTNAYFIEDLLK